MGSCDARYDMASASIAIASPHWCGLIGCSSKYQTHVTGRDVQWCFATDEQAWSATLGVTSRSRLPSFQGKMRPPQLLHNQEGVSVTQG